MKYCPKIHSSLLCPAVIDEEENALQDRHLVELGVAGVAVPVVLVLGGDVGAAAGKDVIGGRDLRRLGRVSLLRTLLLRLVGNR